LNSSLNIVRFLPRLCELARKNGMTLYLIGGSVRDYLLGTELKDFDLMLDRNLEGYLELLKESWRELFPELPEQIKISRFPAYFTAKVVFGEETIDFSQSRAETYPTPGGKPVVRAGSLQEDIRRRDFTINSLALTSEGDQLKVVDLCGGEADLKERILRVHHSKSFEDDPIRLVRAVRFIQRFNLKFESGTEKLFQEAIEKKLLSLIPQRRSFDELRKVLNERECRAILARLSHLGLLEILFPFVAADRIEKLVEGGNWFDNLRTIVDLSDREKLASYLKQLNLEKSLRVELLL